MRHPGIEPVNLAWKALFEIFALLDCWQNVPNRVDLSGVEMDSVR